VGPVVSDQRGEHPPCVAVVLIRIGRHTAGADRDVVGLSVVPGPCSTVTDGKVGIGHQPGIRLDDPVSIPPVTDTGLFSVSSQAIPCLRVDRAHRLGDPVDLRPRACRDRHQDEAQDAVGMGVTCRIGWRVLF